MQYDFKKSLSNVMDKINTVVGQHDKVLENKIKSQAATIEKMKPYYKIVQGFKSQIKNVDDSDVQSKKRFLRLHQMNNK